MPPVGEKVVFTYITITGRDMKSLSDALNAMLESADKYRGTKGAETHQTQPSAGANIEHLPDVEILSPLEVIYHLNKEDGVEVMGDSRSVFATFDRVAEKLTVYAKRTDMVEIIPYRTVSILAALESAQDEGASFTVCGSEVICTLKDITVQGSSYGEAALRALLKHQRKTTG
jgi:hypothetical protein